MTINDTELNELVKLYFCDENDRPTFWWKGTLVYLWLQKWTLQDSLHAIIINPAGRSVEIYANRKSILGMTKSLYRHGAALHVQQAALWSLLKKSILRMTNALYQQCILNYTKVSNQENKIKIKYKKKEILFVTIGYPDHRVIAGTQKNH